MTTPSRLKSLQNLLREQGLGRALPALDERGRPPAPTGLSEIDALLGGGLPRGRISAIVGRGSAGATRVAFSILARASGAGEMTAYVDASDCLDPRSAREAGIVLERLLWVRCDPRERPRYERIALQEARADQAWQAVNLLAQAGGFGVVVLDLGGLSERKLREWRRRRWLRLQRAIEHTPTVLITLAEQRLAGSAAAAALELSRGKTRWKGEQDVLLLLDGVEAHVRVVKRAPADASACRSPCGDEERLTA